MVLPTAAHKATKLPSSAATPDRSLYEAGKGHILSHFADIATPADNNRSDARHGRAISASGARTRARRSLDGLNGELLSAASARNDVHMDSSSNAATKDYSYVSATDRDMEDALFGAHASNNSNNNNSEHELLSQQEKLEQWCRNKERASSAAAGNRVPTHPSAKATHSVEQQPPKRPKAAHTSKMQQHSPPCKPSAASVSTTASTAFAESNQSHESDRPTSQMFSMDFSPPRRTRSSRRATVEVDPSTAAALTSSSDKLVPTLGLFVTTLIMLVWMQQQPKASGKASGAASSTSFSASFMSGREPFSPAVSQEFLTRDLEEEDQALNAKSDRDRAFLYKKRYSDTYGYAVMLARRVMRLETQRADRNAEIDVLRSKVRTQEQIIRAMSQPETASGLGASVQEQQVQSLCREVGALVQQLGERDSIIKTLHTERDESVRVLNDLKLSRAACKAGECVHSSSSSSNSRSHDGSVHAIERPSATRVVELEGVIDSLHDQIAAMRTAFDDLADEKRALEDHLAAMQDKYDDSQHSYAAAEAQREALSSGLEQAHEQLGALHAQWTQEKAELLQSASCDATTAASVAAERDRLRVENAALTSSLSKANASERKVVAQLAQQQTVTAQAQAQVARLERELDAARVKVAALTEREKQLVRVESELERTKEDAAAKAVRIAALEHEVRMKDDEVRAADARFHEKTVYMEKRLFEAEIIRRRLHNKVMELKGNIRVFCRVRPVLAHERSVAGNEEIFAFPDYAGERRQIELTASSKSHVSYGQNGGRDAVKKYSFDFDLVFDSTCSQEEVFLEVSALVQSALDGYNVCIFAYGQTGSGKTFTMQGREDSAGYATMQPSSHMGIVGRAIAHIYATIADLRSSGWDFSVTLEMIEIYNETLRDLLAPPGTADKVDLRLDADGRPAIANSCVHTVVNQLDAWQLLCKAMAKRSTKATSMNDRSSRSHCVITFRMTGVNSLTGDRRVGVVHLVDLAGSERLNKSGSGNDRELLKEAQAINKSLSSLGNVICALAKKSAHVPFRDSKLTHFLSPSLGGDSKTLMICNLSPLKQHRDETLNSLRFAKTVNSCEITYASVSSRS